MKLKYIEGERWNRFAYSLLAILLCIAAWYFLKESRTYSWTESTTAADGRLLIVKRKIVTVSGGGDISLASGRRPDKNIIEFTTIGEKKVNITWESTRRNYRNTYPENPVYIDVLKEKDVPIVISITELKDRESCYVYYVYKYHNDKWDSSPLDKSYVGKLSNIYPGHPKVLPFSIVTNEDRKKKFKDIRVPRMYKVIVTDQIYCR